MAEGKEEASGDRQSSFGTKSSRWVFRRTAFPYRGVSDLSGWIFSQKSIAGWLEQAGEAPVLSL